MSQNQSNKMFIMLLLLFTTVLACTKTEFLDNEDFSIEKPENQNTTLSDRNISTNPADYYIPPTSFPRTRNFRSDNNFKTDDSPDLQKAIDSLSNAGGGRLKIPAGQYTFSDIQMKKNVHIEINKGAIFRPKQKSGKGEIHMFKFSSTNKNIPLKNVSLFCPEGRFKVDLKTITPIGRGVRMCFFKNVDGFYVSNINVLDKHTKFSAFVFNGETIGGKAYGPKNGVLMNVDTNNSDYGYGLVQMQLGKKIFFRNISGTGGTTLRIESHNVNLRPLNAKNVIENVVARNVRCKDGNSSVMLSPHFMKNGYVDIRNISSINCGFAVRIEKGFVTSEELMAYPNLVPGTFDSTSVIRNVKAIYGTTAQLKPKHYGFMPCGERKKVSSSPISPNGASFEGPSIAPVVYNANYTVDFNKSHVTVFEDFISNNSNPKFNSKKVVTSKFNCPGR